AVALVTVVAARARRDRRVRAVTRAAGVGRARIGVVALCGGGAAERSDAGLLARIAHGQRRSRCGRAGQRAGLALPAGADLGAGAEVAVVAAGHARAVDRLLRRASGHGIAGVGTGTGIVVVAVERRALRQMTGAARARSDAVADGGVVVARRPV